MPDVLKMLPDRVLVQRSQAPTQTEGGLHLPSVAGKKPNQGTVLAVGPGKVGPDGNAFDWQKTGDIKLKKK